MDYNIVITPEVKKDLNNYISYLLYVKKNNQAAINLLEAFEKTIENLKRIVGSLKPCDNPRLQKLGYHRINFFNCRYFMLYRIDDNKVF